VISNLDFSYPAILSLLVRHRVKGRTESRAFLAWFLENYYRLEDFDALDCVCDGPDDRGVDGIYLDENLEAIHVFQSKLLQNNARAIGDSSLKEFVGTLAQFNDPSYVEDVVKTTTNHELAALIRERELVERVKQGYEVRGVFLTNAASDPSATRYADGQPSLSVYDRNELQGSYIPEGRTDPIARTIEFDVVGFDASEYTIGTDSRVVVAPLSATDLVRMEGIENQSLFDWNVRQSLGKTNVNKEIANSIKDASEHQNFLLYHNGLTVPCGSLDKSDDKIAISQYTVVNGCQSLTSLYEQRNKLTSELRVLTRMIEISPGSELAFKISHHSNNQNGIKPRDLQSNSRIQARLQEEFNRQYPGQIFYRIKRGEQSDCQEIIDNELAGRILLAFDLQEPWSCHQTYKLFEDLNAPIFGRPEVTAARIVALRDLYQVVLDHTDEIQNKPLANYSLTKFFLTFLLRRALETDETGKRFCQKSEDFTSVPNGRERLKACHSRGPPRAHRRTQL
jgi:AIPR protein